MFKRFVVFLCVMMIFLSVQSLNALTIIEAKGDLETAFVKWESEKIIDYYNVYYSGEGVIHQKVELSVFR